MENKPREQGQSKNKISAFTWIFIFGALALAVIVPRLPMSTDQKLAIGLYAGLAFFGTPILIFVSSFLKFKKVISSYPKLYLWIAEAAFLVTLMQVAPEMQRDTAARTAAQTATVTAATAPAVTATRAAHLTAVSATQTAQPTSTQEPTSTATLLPKFATATEIASFNLIDFRELRDYPSNHIGEKVCLKGRVFNVNPPTEFQMYVGDTYDDAYIVTETEFSKLYRDDPVFICGISADNKTFKNALGAQVSTPLIEHAFFR